MKKSDTFPTDILFKETKSLDLRQLFGHVMIRQYKENNNLIPHSHDYGTKSRVPKPKKTILKRSFENFGPEIFHLLPRTINNTKNLIQQNKKYIHDFNKV